MYEIICDLNHMTGMHKPFGDSRKQIIHDFEPCPGGRPNRRGSGADGAAQRGKSMRQGANGKWTGSFDDYYIYIYNYPISGFSMA